MSLHKRARNNDLKRWRDSHLITPNIHIQMNKLKKSTKGVIYKSLDHMETLSKWKLLPFSTANWPNQDKRIARQRTANQIRSLPIPDWNTGDNEWESTDRTANQEHKPMHYHHLRENHNTYRRGGGGQDRGGGRRKDSCLWKKVTIMWSVFFHFFFFSKIMLWQWFRLKWNTVESPRTIGVYLWSTDCVNQCQTEAGAARLSPHSQAYHPYIIVKNVFFLFLNTFSFS